MSLLEVESLSVGYERDGVPWPAVEDVTLSIEPGEVLGLVGESGCGKTTLGLAISRLLPAAGKITAGRISLDGIDLASCTEQQLRRIRGRRIAMVFQDPSTSLNPVLKIGEQIAEVVRLHGEVGESARAWTEFLRPFAGPLARRGRAWEEAVRLLELTGLPDPADCARRYPHQLSGGMRQRAAIAMALAGSPQLLVADEPTTALDVTVQANVLQMLTGIVRNTGTSVVLVTHDLGVARQFCDRLAVMYGGQLFELSSADEIFDNPQSPYTAALLRSQPRLDGPVTELETLDGEVPGLDEMGQGCRFASRCPEAEDRCLTEHPKMLRLREGLAQHDSNHWCRCLRRERDDDQRAAAGSTSA